MINVGFIRSTIMRAEKTRVSLSSVCRSFLLPSSIVLCENPTIRVGFSVDWQLRFRSCCDKGGPALGSIMCSLQWAWAG